MRLLHEKFSLWWQKNPVKGRISLTLGLLHLVALCYSVYGITLKPEPKKSKILVKTIQASPPQIAPVSSSAKTQEPPSSQRVPPPPAPPLKKKLKQLEKEAAIKPPPPKKIPEQIQKETKKTQSPSSTKPSAAAKKKKPLSSAAKELQKSLKEIEESLSKIEKSNDKIIAKRTKEPTTFLEPPPDIFGVGSFGEDDYVSSLIECMQKHLQLPDSGEVQIQLTLHKDGSIEAMKVLFAESEKNKKRLQEQLPKLQFPPFPKEEQEKKSKVFILTFCNDL